MILLRKTNKKTAKPNNNRIKSIEFSINLYNIAVLCNIQKRYYAERRTSSIYTESYQQG